MKNKIFGKIIVSLFLIWLYTCLLLIFFYPGGSELGKSFGIVSIYMMTRYAALLCGMLFLLLRLIRILKSPSSLLYVFFSLLNLVSGLLAICLYIFHVVLLSWVHVSLLNLLAGVVMMADIFLHSKDTA